MMLPDYDMKWAILALAKEVRSSSLPPDQAALVFLHLGIAAGAISEWALADQVLATTMPYLPPPRQVDCAQHWANALIRLNRTNEALNLLKETVKKIPDDSDLRQSLARAYIKNDNLPDARQEYQNILNMPKLSPQRREQIQAELASLMKRLEKPA
jgi:Flp pilus assembly protein TadD